MELFCERNFSGGLQTLSWRRSCKKVRQRKTQAPPEALIYGRIRSTIAKLNYFSGDSVL